MRRALSGKVGGQCTNCEAICVHEECSKNPTELDSWIPNVCFIELRQKATQKEGRDDKEKYFDC